MDELRCALLADGPSDRSLLPILRWVMARLLLDLPVNIEFIDAAGLSGIGRQLTARIERSLDLAAPIDILFVHRDAERTSVERRLAEIEQAVRALGEVRQLPAVVGVVPVPMTEAWLLCDERAIRRAAGNPNGREPLELPSVRDVESLRDPKQSLHNALRRASGLPARRFRADTLRRMAALVAERVDSFEPLLAVPSFVRLDADVRRVISSWREGDRV